jgi:hypothetical protein
MRKSAMLSHKFHPIRMLNSSSFPLLCGLLLVSSLRAETVTLEPVADTFISERFAGPNGSSPELVMGTQGIVANGARNRGLMKFDLTSIPTNAFIDSVSLRVNVNKRAAGGEGSLFHLHAVKVPWTESAGTWFIRSAGQNWIEPGGAAGTDYAEDSSGNAFVGGIGAVTFDSTTGLVANVTAWLNSPASNNGWLIKTEDESVEFTAGRFSARENPNTAPQLTVEYTVPPPPPQIDFVSIEGTNFCVNFQGVASNIYVLESREDIASGDWMPITGLLAETDGPQKLCDPLIGPKRFYRVGVLWLGWPGF